MVFFALASFAHGPYVVAAWDSNVGRERGSARSEVVLPSDGEGTEERGGEEASLVKAATALKRGVYRELFHCGALA